MSRKRLCAILLAVFLLAGLPMSLASTAGTGDDPLVSLRYAAGEYLDSLLNQGNARAETLDSTGETHSLGQGSMVELALGGSCTLLSGSASLSISAGTVVDVTAGAEAASGALTVGHRYLGAEDARAVVTVGTGGAELLLAGNAAVSGETPPTTPPAGQFSDVPASHWAYAYVEELAGAGLVNGMGDGTFAPDSSMTRGQLVTLLGRLAGVDTGDYGGSPFPDVAAGQYYAPYVAWAKSRGIVNGLDDGNFYPDNSISREQIAAVVVRFAQDAGVQLPSAAVDQFPDHDSISAWAVDAVYAARQAGLINGRAENGNFDPGGNANRAEVCAIVCRLLDLM